MFNFKNTNKKCKKHCFYTFFSSLILLITLICGITVRVQADDGDYYTNLDEDQLEAIFALNVDDVVEAWSWIAENECYVIIEKDGGDYIYWWNSPNMQMSAINSAYDLLANSGYGNAMGTNPNDTEWLINLPKKSEAKTALQRYGFNIPNIAYMGERPLVTISIGGVLKPDGFWDGVGRFFKLIFTGNVVELPTDKDLNSLTYLAPRDYISNSNTFENWVSKNWSEVLKLDDGQIILPSADPDTGECDGYVWVKENVIDGNGLDQLTGADAKEIVSELQQICGYRYAELAQGLIVATGIANDQKVERIMPYDLSRMNADDKALFDGVTDHRAEMQNSLLGTGYDKSLLNFFKSALMVVSGKLAEITVAINNCANFGFLDVMGLDPTFIWTHPILSFLLTIMGIAFVIYIIKTAFSVMMGSKGGNPIALGCKAFLILIISLLIYNFGSDPERAYSFIKNTSSKVLALSNSALTNNSSLSSLYGNGDDVEKENCSLWLPYFNTWTIYNTNHGILENAQTIDTKTSLEPEEDGLISPQIDGVTQTLWSTVLAEEATTEKSYSGNVYRMIDHFMAPRVSVVSLSKTGTDRISLDVKQNENFNGEVQSTLNFASIPWQILLLIWVIIKVVLFFEFILNIALLIVQLSLSVFDSREVGRILKILGASLLNVFFVNTIVTIVIWGSLVTSGLASFIICVFFMYISFCVVKAVAKSSNSNIFKPKILIALTEIVHRFARMFQE